MAGKNLHDAWSRSPESVRGVDLLVLYRVGDNVMNEQTGEGWLDVQRVAQQIHEPEARVLKALHRLEEFGLIEIHPDQKGFQYPTVVYTMTPADDWS